VSAPACVFSHVRKVAVDIERTGRFYVEAFGFELEWAAEGGEGTAFLPLVELAPPVRSALRMYRKGDVRLELSAYEEPPPAGTTERLPMNAIAMTHISFRVPDLEATLAAVRKWGGEVLEHTRVRHPKTGEYVMCLDPDGFRVELMPMTPMPR
jgi:catechol 2,3-dioxygenase-like lactoylglutathione lyase family enzyme